MLIVDDADAPVRQAEFQDAMARAQTEHREETARAARAHEERMVAAQAAHEQQIGLIHHAYGVIYDNLIEVSIEGRRSAAHLRIGLSEPRRVTVRSRRIDRGEFERCRGASGLSLLVTTSHRPQLRSG